MAAQLSALAIGDTIEIKYRVWRTSDGQSGLADRWLVAEIADIAAGSWPLARLVDGQMTEIRPFMEWRLLRRGQRRNLAA